MQEGYIKLYRKIKDWEWYDDVPCRLLFLHLILSANWKGTKWQGMVVERGQLVTSLNTLAAEAGISKQQVRTALSKLEATDVLKTRTTHRYSVITVCNYDSYQADEQPKQHTDNTVATQFPTQRQHSNNTVPTQSTKIINDCFRGGYAIDGSSEQQADNKRTELKATHRATLIEEYKEERNIYNPPPSLAHARTQEPSLTITAEQAPTEIAEILDTPDCAFLIHQRSQMSASEVRAHIEEFTTEARMTGKTWRNRGDLTLNLAAWMAIKKQRLTKQQNYGDSKQAREQAIDDLVNGKLARVLARSRQGT